MQHEYGHPSDLRLEAIDVRELDRLRQGDLPPRLLHPSEAAMVFGGGAAVGIRQREIQRHGAQPLGGLGRDKPLHLGELRVQHDDGLLDRRGVLREQALVDPQRPPAHLPDLPVASGHLHGGLAQGIADAEIRLGVAELMMAMSRVRRILRLSHERARGHEDDVVLELGVVRHVRLRLAQGGPLLRGVDPRPREFTDDDRQLRDAELLADIPDQVREVLLVFRHGGLRVHAVVPALIPD